MTKTEEISNPRSCLNRAGADELLFVLREHDVAAAATIRDWCNRRISIGKNQPGDAQIVEAREVATRMELRRAK